MDNALKRSLVALACVAGIWSGFANSSPAVAAEKPIEIKIASINLLSFASVWVAKELGYFKDEGLDVTLVVSQSGKASASALIGGSVEATTAGFDTALQLTDVGVPAQHLVGILMSSSYIIVGKAGGGLPKNDPKAVAQALKGKRFGVASTGSTGDTITRGFLKEFGTNADELTFVDVGVGATALAALKTGAVDAIISYEPDLSAILKSGAGEVIFDLRTTTAEAKYSKLPTSTLEATAAWIKKNPEAAAALVRAVDKGNVVMRTKPDVALPVLKKLYPDLSPDVVEAMYRASAPQFTSVISEDVYQRSAQIFMDAGLIKKIAPYQSAVAVDFAKYWTKSQ